MVSLTKVINVFLIYQNKLFSTTDSKFLDSVSWEFATKPSSFLLQNRVSFCYKTKSLSATEWSQFLLQNRVHFYYKTEFLIDTKPSQFLLQNRLPF